MRETEVGLSQVVVFIFFTKKMSKYIDKNITWQI